MRVCLSMNTTIESKRWRFQYTLRSLLILMFVVCLGMSWVAVRMRKADRQRKAVESIRKFGGLVYYEHAFDDLKHVRHRPQPPIPRFVQDLLGDDFFADVLYIDLGPTKVSDADLECLETLDRLEWLVLSDTEITDAGLVHLKEFPTCEFSILEAPLPRPAWSTSRRSRDLNTWGCGVRLPTRG